jgi:1-acyl-sn-glycerol-3-phosphate acyltransferase
MRKVELRIDTIPYYFVRTTVLLIMRLRYKISFLNLELIPPGPVIVVSNHVSYFDPLIIGPGFPGKLGYIAKEELFENKIQSLILKALASVPVKRGTVDRKSIKQALEMLKKGECLGVFPEGTRSQDGEVTEGKHGAAMFSIMSGAPIVPAAIIGTMKSNDDEKKKSSKGRKRVIVQYGEPIYPDRFEGQKKERMEKMTEASLESIRQIKKELENVWEL